MIYEPFSPEAPYDLRKPLGENATPGSIICLDGDLGVGKTVLTQGFAVGLGIADNVIVRHLQ